MSLNLPPDFSVDGSPRLEGASLWGGWSLATMPSTMAFSISWLISSCSSLLFSWICPSGVAWGKLLVRCQLDLVSVTNWIIATD